MKKLFGLFIPLCILGFIAFGISVAVFGKNTSGINNHGITESNFNDTFIVSGSVIESRNWEIASCPSVDLTLAGINTEVKPSDSDKCTVTLNNPSGKDIYVAISHSYDDSILRISMRPSEINIFDIFSAWKEVSAEITLPMGIYENLDITQGSGDVNMTDIYASGVYVDINSGTFSYTREVAYTGNNLNVNLNSGKAELNNICSSNNSYIVNYGELSAKANKPYVASNTELDLNSGTAILTNAESEKYNLDIGSGRFEINGLSGSGKIDMGSGSGKISFLEVNGYSNIDIGSGNLEISLPKNEAGSLIMDIGSGSIDVNYGGSVTKYHSSNCDDIVYLGNYTDHRDDGSDSRYFRDEDGTLYRYTDGKEYVECGFEVEMGSGHISFKELPFTSSEYTEQLTNDSSASENAADNGEITDSSSSETNEETTTTQSSVETGGN